MQGVITQLEQQNNKYKIGLQRNALKSISSIMSKAQKLNTEFFIQNLKSLAGTSIKSDSMNSNKTKSIKSSKSKTSTKEINTDSKQSFREKILPPRSDKVIDKILDACEMNSSIQSVKEKAKILKENRQRLLFDSPLNEKLSENSSIHSNRQVPQYLRQLSIDEKSSNNKYKPESEVFTPSSQQIVLTDLINFNYGTGNKKSSTAAFNTLTSSNKKYLVSESPESENIVKIIEERKTVKRSNREYVNSTNQVWSRKLIGAEPENNNTQLIRKNKKRDLNIIDEGHAEPFEIIETSDFKDRLKESSLKRHKEIRQATPTNLQFDIEKTEKKVVTSSF